jgi:hypothetical protein
LDPRIYPSWWGEDYAPSPEKARKLQMAAEIPVKLPETSLERGMREIRETASKLDRNLPMFRQDTKSAEESQILNF